MAKKEAYCTHCGSLINVDDSKDKAKCIFCGQEMDTARAIELNNDSESRMLLQKAADEKAREVAASRKDKEKLSMKEMAERAKEEKAKGPKQEIVLKPLPMKTKLILLASFLGFAIIIAAIYIPLLTIRNANRVSLRESMGTQFEIEDPGSDIAFLYNDNRYLTLSTKDTVGEEGAQDIYDTYISLYAQVYGADEAKVREKIIVTIFDAEGRYVCSYRDGDASVVFETGSPTHTPEPTVIITD